MKRTLAAVAVLVALGTTVFAAAPAAAAVEPPTRVKVGIGDLWNLWDYVLTVKSQQLLGMQGDAAIGAWSAQNARIAATSANTFRSGLLYGNLAAETIAEVIPIYDPIDLGYGNGRTITPQAGKPGFRIPAFPGHQLIKGAGAAAAAVSAFQLGSWVGAGVSGPVLGFFGIDANGLVCSQEQNNFGGTMLAIISGQNCDAYKLEESYVANMDIIPGLSGIVKCNPATGFCVKLVGQTTNTAAAQPRYCFLLSGTVPSGTALINEMRAVRSPGGTSAGQIIYREPAGAITTGQTCALGRYDGMIMLSAAGMVLQSYGFGTDLAPVTTTEADPDRYLECVVTGSNGSSYSAVTANFKETDGAFPSPNCPTLPAGVYATHMTITERWGTESSVLYDEDVDEEYLDWQTEHGADCSAQTCFLDLVTVANGLSCFGQKATCDGWVDDPARDTKYACYYGGESVAIESCYVYGTTFSEKDRLAGGAYADPLTGEPIPSGGTSLSVEQQLYNLAPRDAAEVRDCLGGTYASFNPVEWIFRPLQCGLEWAFVPRPEAAEASAVRLESAFADRAPGQLISLMNGWALAPIATGCKVEVQYSAFHGAPAQTVPVVDACPGSYLAPIADISRIVTSVGFSVLVFLAIKRAVSGTVDYRG